MLTVQDVINNLLTVSDKNMPVKIRDVRGNYKDATEMWVAELVNLSSKPNELIVVIQHSYE